jgi:CelD/BcsL family acetyltransferase involved in cellulose biosynthesis
MSVALPLDGNPIQTTVSRADGSAWIAAVQVQDNLAAVEAVWRHLQSEQALATPYQNYDFLASWQRCVGARTGVNPIIVSAYDPAGHPLFLWPLGYADRGPFRILQFLGGKHANVNLGLWHRDTAALMTAADLALVLNRVAASGHGIDLVALRRQPSRWTGVANPLLLLPHQPSPSDSCRRDLVRSLDGAVDLEVSRGMRKQLRGKDRKLTALPGYRCFRASTSDEVERLLGWFFSTKAKHLSAQGLANAFAEPGVQDFVRDICHSGLAQKAPLAELHATEANGELLAVLAGIGDGRRFSSMFNTYTLGPLSRFSPGLVLMLHMIADLGERGYASFDLGVGDATYKRGFCREVEPLFDSFLPLTPKGHLAALGARSATAAKRGIKRTPRLFAALQNLQRYLRRS